MATATAPSSAPRAKTESASQHAWKLYVFEVTRQPGKASANNPVKARRVRVYAPFPEAAVAGAGVSRDEKYRQVLARPWEQWGMAARPQRQEIADFYETLGSTLETGAGLSRSLNMAARMANAPMMRGIIGALQAMVAKGMDLHDAMRSFPRVFSPMQLAMVAASSETGLDKAGGLLKTLASRLQKEGKLWRKFLGGISYPVSLILLTMVGAVVLEIFALPPMVELFKTLGGTLPKITQVFYNVAQFLHKYALIVFPGVIALVVGLVAIIPAIVRTRTYQQLVVKLYVVGPIVQWMALSRALGTFILLKKSGAKVRDQFQLAAAAAGNCIVGDFFDACYGRICVGETVEEAFTAERHRLGKDGLRIAGRMEVGMEGGDLDVLLGNMVDDLTDRADTRLTLLPTLLRWPLLVICCFMIGVVALAIVLPYPSLIADVARQQVMTANGQ